MAQQRKKNKVNLDKRIPGEEMHLLEKLQNLLKTFNQIWEDDTKLLHTFFKEMREKLQAQNAFLAFVNEERSNSIKILEQEPDNFSRTIILKTIETNATTFIPDTSVCSSLSESIGRIGIRSVVCTPFHCSDAIQGVFYVDRHLHLGPFSEQECHLIEIVCEQLAHIIRNSRFHRKKLEDPVAGAIWKERIAWGMVGQSRGMQEIFKQIRTLSQEESTVLIIGETGTGKEMIARALHYNSNRKEGPFIGVNCAAIPSGLLESELFGYEQGAFSGARSRKIGKFELAQGGTLFFDEMCEIPTETQAKLLRVLQEREFERLGGTKKIRMDVRILSATNQEPREAIARGKLRLDFYQRLAVYLIRVPPLRERSEDILLLVQYFIVQKNGHLKELSPEASRKLTSYGWPGNVRELENTIERALFVAKDHAQIEEEDIQLYHLYSHTQVPQETYTVHILKEALQSEEVKDIIHQILQESREKGEGKKTKDLEQFILSKLKEGRILSCKELSEGSGYERRTVQKALRKLVGENRVKVIGMGKNISYRLGCDTFFS